MRNLISSPKENKKLKIILTKTFSLCFLLAILLILSCSIVFISGNDNLGNVNRIFMITIITTIILIGSLLIYATFKFFNKKSTTWNYKIQIVNSFLIIVIAFTIAYTVQMKYQLADGKNCISIAKQLSSTMNWYDLPYGNEYSGYRYALIRCYNLAPFIYLQALVFKLFSLIGIKLSFSGMVALGTYANTVMLLTSMYLAFHLVKKYCKVSTQTGFTFLLLINIPLYATVYYVYTDIPALLAIMVILTAYDALIHANSTKNKTIYISIIILTSIIGALFKFNVLIALFAIIIHYFLTHNWKHNIKFILLLLVPTMLGISGIKSAITTTSPVPQSELGLPATNWINMSFSKIKTNGGFNNTYFKHTYKLKEKHIKNNIVAKIEIKELLNGILKHPTYYLYIIYRKIGITYGIGNYDFNSFFTVKYIYHSQMKKTFLGQILYGKFKKIFLYSTFILQLSLFLFMGLGTFILFKKNIQKVPFCLPWMIALFGNMFMLLFWETHSRYLLPFVGTIYMIACVGIEQVLDARDQKKLKAKNK